MGPQGGFHIWLSVGMAQRPADSFPRVAWQVNDGSTSVGGGVSGLGLREVSGGFEDSGVAMMLDWGMDYSPWMDHPVTIQVTLRDSQDQPLGTVTRTWRTSCCEYLGPGGGDDAGVRDGEDGGAFGGGPTDGGVGNGGADCLAFCELATQPCGNGAAAPFTAVNPCMAACQQWPQGPAGSQGGNSLTCRMYYMEQAQTDVSMCPRLQQTWDTFCTDG